MSSMMQQPQMDTNSQGSVAQFSGTAPVHKIKRIGGRPLVFQGVELAMAMSFTPKLPYWYEINMYRSAEDRFVACVRLFFVSSDEQDTARAWECGSVDQAIEALVAYDAADDVRLTLDQASEKMSAAELAAQALELRAQAKAYRQHYATLIGEFLHDLEASD